MILTGLLATNMYVQANEEINYSYLEIGYGYLDLQNNNAIKGLYLDGAFNLSDHFYISGYVEDRDLRNIDFNRYHLSLGFHTNGSSKTDFYTDFRVGKIEYDNLDGKTAGLYAGTRTAFNDRFELISKVGFTHVDNIRYADGKSANIYEAEVKGLFKFSNNQAMSASLENFDGDDFGAKIGYRYSF